MAVMQLIFVVILNVLVRFLKLMYFPVSFTDSNEISDYPERECHIINSELGIRIYYAHKTKLRRKLGKLSEGINARQRHRSTPVSAAVVLEQTVSKSMSNLPTHRGTLQFYDIGDICRGRRRLEPPQVLITTARLDC